MPNENCPYITFCTEQAKIVDVELWCRYNYTICKRYKTLEHESELRNIDYRIKVDKNGNIQR